MAIYTFYRCNLGGVAGSFEAFALGTDAEAPERALKVLKDQPSCTDVAVWDDKRQIPESRRGAPQGDTQPTLSVFA
jgi:hypothetical protein